MRFILLALAFLALVSWQPAAFAQEVFTPPTTCGDVARFTSRGGASLPTAKNGGFGCFIQRPPDEGLVRVERVIDGDTIVIEGGARIRYIGIDTPEVNGPLPEPFGKEATELNRKLLQGRYVRLVKDISETDRFGRLLRYVFVDGMMVEAELVREGYAVAKAYPPDTSYAACLEDLEREAREEHRGMWGQ